ALRVLEALDHPHPAALVDGHGDRVDDHRLGGEQLDLEPVGDLHPADRLGRRQVRLAGRLAVVEAEFLLGGRGGDEGGEEGEREAGADGHRRLRDGGGRPPRLVYDWRTKRKPHRRACSDTFTATSWPNGPSP